MKPIPLSAFSNSFIPPVTGVNNLSAPVANSFDPSGHFRQRIGSANKRRRGDEEIDMVFDLSSNYPPLVPPPKSKLDLGKIGELMVAANALGSDVKKIAEDPGTDTVAKTICNMNLSLLAIVSALLEDGLAPLAAGARTGAGFPGRSGPAAPPKPAAAPGLKELREGLERAERECVLFDADLGSAPVANRAALARGLSAGIHKAVTARAAGGVEERAEAVRVADDALSCVSDMEFLGAKSQPFQSKRDAADPRNKTFCTMPVKLSFEDKSARLNFERTAKSHMGLRAVMSLPLPIRVEQAAFLSALKQRYNDEIITVRPDTASLSLIAFRKRDGERGWTRCHETLELLPGTLLPGYSPRRELALPPDISVSGGGAGSAPGE